jgi:hypothetical protein
VSDIPQQQRKSVTQQQSHPAAEVGVTEYSLPAQRLLRSFEVTGTEITRGGGGTASNCETRINVESVQFMSVPRNAVLPTRRNDLFAFSYLYCNVTNGLQILWKGVLSLTLFRPQTFTIGKNNV